MFRLQRTRIARACARAHTHARARKIDWFYRFLIGPRQRAVNSEGHTGSKQKSSVRSQTSELISYQQTDGSAHLNQRSKQHHMSWNRRFNLQSSKPLYRSFRKQHGHVLCLWYLDNPAVCLSGRYVLCLQVLGQPGGLSKWALRALSTGTWTTRRSV